MNEQDLRVIKTKERIESALLELLKMKPLEKITVTELARMAMINKGTFYLHYLDIFDLYRQTFLKWLEKPVRDAAFFPDFFDAPDRFLDRLGDVLLEGLPMVRTIQQSDQQDAMFFTDVRAMLCRKVYETGRIRKTLQNDIKLDAVFSAMLAIMPLYFAEHSREAHRVVASIIRSQFPKKD